MIWCIPFCLRCPYKVRCPISAKNRGGNALPAPPSKSAPEKLFYGLLITIFVVFNTFQSDEESMPLAQSLLNALCDLLFCPDFTVVSAKKAGVVS